MDKWYNYAADNPHSTNEIKIGSTRWASALGIMNFTTIQQGTELSLLPKRMCGFNPENQDKDQGRITMTNRKHPTNLFYLWNKSLYR